MANTRLVGVAVILNLGIAYPANSQTFERMALPFPPDLDATIMAALEKSESLVVSPEEALDALRAAEWQSAIQSLCGNDDSQDVETYDGTLGPTKAFVANNQSTTGQLQWNDDLVSRYPAPDANPGNVSGARWCSGMLIQESMFLTAGHCFDKSAGGWVLPKKKVDGKWTTIEPSEITRNMHLNFNYQVDSSTGEVRVPDQYPVTELAEYRLDGLDFAIIRVGLGKDKKSAGSKFGTHKIAASNPAGMAAITVFQHPQGNPKKIEAGAVAKIETSLLLYDDVDTQGGSSGANIINEYAEIVGVHIQGGCKAVGPGFNKGTPIASIRKASSIID